MQMGLSLTLQEDGEDGEDGMMDAASRLVGKMGSIGREHSHNQQSYGLAVVSGQAGHGEYLWKPGRSST